MTQSKATRGRPTDTPGRLTVAAPSHAPERVSEATLDTAPDPTTQRGASGAAWTEPIALPTASGMASAIAHTFGQRGVVGKAALGFLGELGRVARGSSTLAPEKGDWRFTDPTWSDNAVYRRLVQAYVAFSTTLDGLVDELEASGKDGVTARFTVNLLTSAVAPSNFLLGNPAALKRSFETGGASVVSGMRNRADDLLNNGGLPSTTDRTALKVGRDLALTAGAVIQRDEVAEVIQYGPSTDEVYERPVLIVPPPIGRFYFLDLRPGRSFVEYSTSQGLQTFLISWLNPGKDQAAWDLDTYSSRILSAIEAVKEITGSPDVNVIGFCAGGILSTGVLNHLAAGDDSPVKSMSYAVTLLDFDHRAPIQAFSHAKLLSFARSRNRKPGVISARDMGAAFTLMRPNDLIWNYWVNNYLMGNKPSVFDVLSWNADGTNLPARLHTQFLDIFEQNSLCEPGAATILDTPVDLESIKVPTFVVGAITDHLTPWEGCYRTTQLLGGDTTFVLSNSGHIQSLVNPPGNPKASYYTGPDPGPDPAEWMAEATKASGSWWEEWSRWVIGHSGAQRAAPPKLGSAENPRLCEAPGEYVHLAAPKAATR